MSERGVVVVITGATSGVGRATARAFARQGARVALLARGEDGLEATRRDVEELDGVALAIPTDVADADRVEAAAARVEDELGPIDVWVNNAMTTIFAATWDITPAEYRRATEVTYLGFVWGTMAALRRMRPRNRGTIVQVGSALAYRSIPLQAPYCGAKFAIRGFTDSVRCELIHEKSDVHITMVQLPGLNTPQFNHCRAKLPLHPQPVPPIYEPDVAADAIVWASRQRRREVTVGLSAVKAIYGNKLVPGLLDHYLADVAWDGQMGDRPIAPDRPDNLFEPLPGDVGARGGFGQDRDTRERSVALWANRHRDRLLAGAGALAAGLIVGLMRR